MALQRARGICSDRNHSYVSLERIARRARRAVRPELDDDAPLPRGPRGVFEQLGKVNVGSHANPTLLTYGVRALPPGIEGEARYNERTGKIDISLSPETYEELEAEEPRGQFSTCHEVMHGFLHRSLLKKLSILPHSELALLRQAPHPDYQDTEWQANAGAAAMLMPALGLERLREIGALSTSRVMDEFGVSRQSAAIRIGVFSERRDVLLAA